MSAHMYFRLRNPVLLMALSAAFPLTSDAGVANVDFSIGGATAVSAGGVSRPLSKGTEISNGDTISTGDNGRVQVRFSDGALVSLQPKTEFRIDDYRYSGKADGEEKGFFSLLKGGVRTITGWVGRSNRENYKVTTSVATIGIRGTGYKAVFNPAPDGEGELDVATSEGLVEVCNGAGCMLLASGEAGVVTGASAPQRTGSHPLLSPEQPEIGLQPVFTSGDNLAVLYMPTSPMPTTGTATYSTILSKSSVVESTGAWAPGTLNSASLSVNFGTLTVSSNLQGTINAQTFSVTGTGSIAGNTLSTTIPSGSGSLCVSNCTGSVSGTFYGTSAERAGINYKITADTMLSPSTIISGSAVLSH